MSQLGLQYDEVKLEKHTSAWSKDFLKDKENIENVCPADILHIEHVGSTSVPGMPAKPIIDILVGINRYSDYKKLIKPLSKIGYQFYREPRRYQALFLKNHQEIKRRIISRLLGIWGSLGETISSSGMRYETTRNYLTSTSS